MKNYTTEINRVLLDWLDATGWDVTHVTVWREEACGQFGREPVYVIRFHRKDVEYGWQHEFEFIQSDLDTAATLSLTERFVLDKLRWEE